MIIRRSFLGGVMVSLLLAQLSGAVLAQSPRITVHKDPDCACCGAWVDHLRSHGFDASIVETAQLNRIKARVGVPNSLASCHTAEIDGFIIEGHVPAGSIQKLLSMRPSIRGLAVPGMPIGSPGMEVAGREPEVFTVIAFGPTSQTVFARYNGARELPLQYA